MDEAVLADLEAVLAWPERRMAPEDLTPQQKVDLLVSNSHLVQAVPDLVAEVRRLRGWLRGMVDATVRVEEPCGWCVELQGWAVEALTGTPFDAAVVRGEGDGDGR